MRAKTSFSFLFASAVTTFFALSLRLRFFTATASILANFRFCFLFASPTQTFFCAANVYAPVSPGAQEYVTASPVYTPASPTYTPASPGPYTPSSPVYTPASPGEYTPSLPAFDEAIDLCACKRSSSPGVYALVPLAPPSPVSSEEDEYTYRFITGMITRKNKQAWHATALSFFFTCSLTFAAFA